MPLTKEQSDLLKGIYQSLPEKEPLEPGDPRYEPLYERAGYSAQDPVTLLGQTIEWNITESLQLFSGFRGSGKTTELFRLRQRLREQGYIVLYANASDYLPQGDVVDITPFLLAVAGAFSDALERDLKIELGDQSVWERFRRYLTKTQIKLEGMDFSPGPDLGIKFRTQIRESPGFRQELAAFSEHNIASLRAEAVAFIDERVKAIRGAYTKDRDKGIVFLFDNLEQIRGSRTNEIVVTESVTRLFNLYYPRMFELPGVHAIYTVPPWLKFAAPNAGKITLLPCVHLWGNDGGRTPDPAGFAMLRSLVHRRFGEEGYRTCFGDDGQELQHLIDSCGGHVTDLLYLLRETLLRTKVAEQLPVTPATVDLAIAAVRGNFLPIAVDDAHWLQEIARHRTTALKSREAKDVQRLTLFLDTHFVLYFKNGEEWYDIHPLIREAVDRICGQFPRPATTPAPSAPATPAAPSEAPV
jgi:hypothetical protein